MAPRPFVSHLLFVPFIVLCGAVAPVSDIIFLCRALTVYSRFLCDISGVTTAIESDASDEKHDATGIPEAHSLKLFSFSQSCIYLVAGGSSCVSTRPPANFSISNQDGG